MTDTQVRETVLAALARIAPEIDPKTIRGDQPLRDEVDLDSIDFLNFILEMHARIGVDVPERDYPGLATLDGCVSYFASHAAAAASASPGAR